MEQIHAATKLLSRILETFEKKLALYFITNFFFKIVSKIIKNLKTSTYVRGDISICMCTKFQVNTFENGLFRAFQRPKMATFRDNPTHNQEFVFHFYSFLQAPNVVLTSFFVLMTIKQPKNMYHEAKWPKSQDWPRDLGWPWPDLRSRKAQNDALEC